jgi:hypothetical protein
MNEMNTGTNVITRNWQIVSAAALLVFSIGGLYTEQKMLHKELDAMKEAQEQHKVDALNMHDQMQQKQDRKWGDIEEIEQRVDDLEEMEARRVGYEQGRNEKK